MADTGRHATRRDKGAGAITKLGNGRYRAFVELSPDPADGSRRRTSATGHTRTEALNNARAKARRIEEDITLAVAPRSECGALYRLERGGALRAFPAREASLC